MAWWALAWPAWAQPAALPTLRLTQAELAFGEAPVPPAEGWVPVVLPDVFKTSVHTGARIGWYRFAFDLPEVPDQPLVLLVQRVVLTAEVRVNGSLLTPGVRFQGPDGRAGTQMVHRPLWLTLPSGVLRAGRNELLVRLSGDQVTPARLFGVSIGTPEALRGEFLLRDIPQRVLPQALLALMLAALLFGLRLWWRQRLPLQGLMMLTGLVWLFGLSLYLWPDLPVPRRVGVFLIVVQWIVFHGCLLLLLWRLCGERWAWYPRVMAVGLLLPLVGSMVVLALEPGGQLLGLLMLPLMLLRCLSTALLLRWAWQVRTVAALLLTASELLWFAGPIQLLLVVTHVVQPAPFMLSPADALPLFLALLWIGAQQLARQRDEAALQRQAAVLEERQRMMLDMHDGIGSQLVTALRLARREDVPRADLAQLLQEALHDLRLIIDAQDSAAQELQSLLQEWRGRHERRLGAPGAQGPQVQWQIDPLPAARPLSPPEALQVLRILQEALSNAMQHAGARTIRIALAAVPGGSELRVADDGAGLSAAGPGATPSGGRGLTNMQRRASRLGAQLQVQAADHGGTVVRLFLPDPSFDRPSLAHA